MSTESTVSVTFGSAHWPAGLQGLLVDIEKRRVHSTTTTATVIVGVVVVIEQPGVEPHEFLSNYVHTTTLGVESVHGPTDRN